MKVLVAARHPEKGPDGWVLPSELEKLEKFCSAGVYNPESHEYRLFTEIFYGPEPRSMQCAIHAAAALGTARKLHPLAKVHGPIWEVGNNEVFGEIATERFLGARKCKVPIFTALRILHPAEKIAEWESKLVPGLQKIFDLISPNGTGFLPGGHAPTIPMWVNSTRMHHDPFRNWDIQGLEACVFEQHDNGEIVTVHVFDPTADPLSDIHRDTPIG